MRGFPILALSLLLVVPSPSYGMSLDPQDAGVEIQFASFETSLIPARMRGPIADADSRVLNVSLTPEDGPLPAGIVHVVIMAPLEFIVLDATAPQTFHRIALDQKSDDGGPHSGKWFAEFAGVYGPDLYANFTLTLGPNATVGDGDYAFDVIACNLPFPGACTTGTEAAPALTIDGTPPNFTALEARSPFAPSTPFTDGPAALTWAGVDDLADVAQYALSDSPFTDANATWRTGALPATFTLSASASDGVRTLYAAVRDDLNNSRFRNATIALDRTPPSITIAMDRESNAAGWWGGTGPTLTASAVDGAGSGVATVGAWLDSAPDEVSTSLAIPEGSAVAVSFAATDLVGRTASGATTLNVDLTDPVVAVAEILPNVTGWHQAFPVATVNASDALSGVDSMRYRFVVDDAPGEWIAFEGGDPIAFVDDAESVAFEYEIGDVAGNVITGSLGPVAIDTQAPEAPALTPIPALLGRDTISLAWSPVATGPSGFAGWRIEQLDAGEWTPIATPEATTHDITDLAHGSLYSWRVVATSGAGLETASAPVETLVDLLAPDVTFEVAPSFHNGTWFTGPGVEAVLTLDEPVSSVGGESTFTLDGVTQPFAAGETRIPLADSESVVLGWNVVDEAGHWSNVTLAPFGVDTTPPVLLAPTVEALQGVDGHFTAPVYVNFSATDVTSGLALIEHSLDGENWTAGDAIVTTPGAWTLTFRAIDAAGLPAEDSIELEIATLTATATLDGLVRELSVLTGTVSVGSADAEVIVDVDGVEERIPVTGPTWTLPLAAPLADGEHAIAVRVVDAAGRFSTPATYSVIVDSIPPELTLDLPSVTKVASPTLSFSTSEALDGPALVGLSNADGWTTLGVLDPLAPLALPLPGDGSFQVRVSASDRAGNSATKTSAILRDTIAPQIARTSAERVLLADDTLLTFSLADASPTTFALVVTRDDGTVLTGDEASLLVPLDPTSRSFVYDATVTDVAGNAAHDAGTVRIVDPAAPRVLITLEGTSGNSGWYRSPVTAHLVADPTSATVLRGARLEGEPPAALVEGATIALDGTARHLIDHQAYEVREGIRVESLVDMRLVLIDLDAPSVELLAPLGAIPEGTRVPVRAAAADVGSGIATVVAVVSRDGALRADVLARQPDGTFAGLIGPLVHGEPATLRLIATDVAGNEATTAASALSVTDATAPFVLLDIAPRVGGIVTLAATTSDASGGSAFSFAVDGAPSSLAWDTTLVPNGVHTVSVVAVDPSLNEATDARSVFVANPPTLGAITLAADPGRESAAYALSVPTVAAGGRAADVRFFARANGVGDFVELPVATTDCSPTGCIHVAEVATAYPPGTLLEAFALAEDGPASARTHIAAFTIDLPLDTELSLWIDRAQAAVTSEATPELPQGHLDIVEAGVFRGVEETTFAARVRSDFDPSADATYVVEFSEGATGAPFSAYELRLAPDGAWMLPSGATLSATNDEWRLRVPTADLDALIGDRAADLHVRFASRLPDPPTPPEGPQSLTEAPFMESSDVTASAPLDVVAPTLSVTAAGATRDRSVSVVVSASDASPVSVRLLAALDGVALPEPSIDAQGVAGLGILRGSTLSLTVIGVDASGNRAMTTTLVDLLDADAPTAVAGVIGSSVIAEGIDVILSGDGSQDNAGIVSYSWDLDGDGVADLFGRRAVARFHEPGSHEVTLSVRDAGGLAGSHKVTIRVIDVTPPTLELSSPAQGEVLPVGSVPIVVLAPDATSVEVNVDGGAWLPATRGEAGRWTRTVLLGEGPHVIGARAADASLNVALTLAPTHVTVDGTSPVVRIAAAVAMQGTDSTFQAIVDEANGIRSVRWSFGDGATRSCASCTTISYAYPNGGAFEVVVRVTDVAGLEATAKLDVRIPAPAVVPVAPPSVAFTATGASAAIAGHAVEFRGGEAPGGPAMRAWYWDFGDGTRASGAAVTHAYATAGRYVVTVTGETFDYRYGAIQLVVNVAPALASTPSDDEAVPAEEEAPLVDAPPKDTEASPTPVGPAPVTIHDAPVGPTDSPAIIHFDAGEGTVVYWRSVGTSAWSTQSPAVVAGDGAVTVEFYALGAGGRELRRSLTLDLDGFAPFVGDVAWTIAEGSAEIRARVDDSHLVGAELILREVTTNATRSVTMAREGTTHVARIAELAEGEYEVVIVATDAAGKTTEFRVERSIVLGGDPLESTGGVAAAADRGTPAGGVVWVVAAACLALLGGRRRGR